MDKEEKRLYHQKYNREYYLKNKFAKQETTGTYFRKNVSSLNNKKLLIEKKLKENEDKKNKFIEQLKSQSNINVSHNDKTE